MESASYLITFISLCRTDYNRTGRVMPDSRCNSQTVPDKKEKAPFKYTELYFFKPVPGVEWMGHDPGGTTRYGHQWGGEGRWAQGNECKRGDGSQAEPEWSQIASLSPFVLSVRRLHDLHYPNGLLKSADSEI
ncbi:hypothetical protein [Microbulbifer sp. 2205BS26-8]|uniref:hypothetical protein n=1 Tax=Microbulbifer sp. 2205BS26-8 TaxID=3064386 RepID=UPI00273E2C17|nr:hypothetical protein [Microbulbifer sp. 2205BS26-8]MDP5211082.1 hypothetical protein [Microbulbifer sp. 2205BS26-8]